MSTHSRPFSNVRHVANTFRGMSNTKHFPPSFRCSRSAHFGALALMRFFFRTAVTSKSSGSDIVASHEDGMAQLGLPRWQERKRGRGADRFTEKTRMEQEIKKIKHTRDDGSSYPVDWVSSEWGKWGGEMPNGEAIALHETAIDIYTMHSGDISHLGNMDNNIRGKKAT